MRSDLSDGRRSGPARPSAGFLTANTLRILPFSSCSCTELPAQSPDTPWPPHPTLLSVRRRPTQYRRTCPLPATPKKECPCLVSSRHRSKGKRLKPDTRSREIRKENPVYPTTDQKTPRKKMPKIYTRASLRSRSQHPAPSIERGHGVRCALKEAATSLQGRRAATRGTAGAALRRRCRRASGRMRGP